MKQGYKNNKLIFIYLVKSLVWHSKILIIL